MSSCGKMSGGSRKRKTSKRGRRGGSVAPLAMGKYPGNGDVSWQPAVPSSHSSASNSLSFKTPLQEIAKASGGQGANPDLAAKMFNEQSTSMKGGKRKSQKKTYRRPLSQAQQLAAAQQQTYFESQSQTGGLFSGFSALLKEALVPLGLLAAEQSYGKKYRTRKHRRH